MREYVLTIGNDRFYLTKDEADFYLAAAEKGKEHVVIDSVGVLGTKFRSLVHKNVIEGKWQCSKGIWHGRGAECHCDDQYEKIPDGRMRLLGESH